MPIIEVYKIDESFIRPATDEDRTYNILYFNGGKYVLQKSIWNYNPKTDIEFTEGVERMCLKLKTLR
jgi:hypothetical protein